jgi:hypothetical protein
LKRLVFDGWPGFHCALFAARYTYLKYEHARSPNTASPTTLAAG